MAATDLVISKVQTEQEQSHATRKSLFIKLEKAIDRAVLSFFTSFQYPVSIEDSDAEILEGILQKMDLSNGLALFLSSPGGDGLAAERIINICRNYSDTGEYSVIVPGKAKSAATLICFGSSEIKMGASSELGPVDPQYTVVENDSPKRFSVFNILESYDELFKKANATKGNLEPFLQQLQRYDAREIKKLRTAFLLSQDLAVKTLKSGMMSKSSESAIKKSIEIFLSPKVTKSHGRPIYRKEAKKCGLNIDCIDSKSDLWKIIYELYIRTNTYVNSRASKCIESKNRSFYARRPGNT